MAQKEAFVFCVDVGPSMNVSIAADEPSSLHQSLTCLQKAIVRKIFSKSKDEIALILFGCVETANKLAEQFGGHEYSNIKVVNPLQEASWDMVRCLDNIECGSNGADFIDALIVALDLLMRETQGRKFTAKSIVLFTVLGEEASDDKLDTVISNMKNLGVNLTAIGPSFDDSSSGEVNGFEPNNKASTSAGLQQNNDRRLKKTGVQRCCEKLLQRMLHELDGDSFSFSEALPRLSFYQNKAVKPTAWKCNLEIGHELTIPICSYVVVQENKLKESWKNVYAKDEDTSLITDKTYHVGEQQTEIEEDAVVKAYRYGTTLIPIDQIDEQSNRLNLESKCFQLLAFVQESKMPRHLFTGSSVRMIVADAADPTACVALSALINAMKIDERVAIVRYAYRARSDPHLVVLVPKVKVGFECFLCFELAYAEDMRLFSFGSLDTDLTRPSDKQLNACDSLISAMDLSEANVDESGDRSEALKSTQVMNPNFQRLFQCLYHRVLHPNKPLPEGINEQVLHELQAPEEVRRLAAQPLKDIGRLFKLEVIERKEQKENPLAAGTNNAEPAVKKSKQAATEEIDGISSSSGVNKIRSTTALADFEKMLSNSAQRTEAYRQMAELIRSMVLENLNQFVHDKAYECLKVFRKSCIENNEPGEFNHFLKTFKTALLSGGKDDFWERIVTDEVTLIDASECANSAVTPSDAKAFLRKDKHEAKAAAVSPKVEDEDADLLAMME